MILATAEPPVYVLPIVGAVFLAAGLFLFFRAESLAADNRKFIYGKRDVRPETPLPWLPLRRDPMGLQPGTIRNNGFAFSVLGGLAFLAGVLHLFGLWPLTTGR